MQQQEFQQHIKHLEGICSRKSKQIEKLEMDFHEILHEQFRVLEEIVETKRELKERESVIRQMTVKNAKIKGLLRDQRVDLSELKARKNIKEDLKVCDAKARGHGVKDSPIQEVSEKARCNPTLFEIF